MKILWDNYLSDSTVTASSENGLYQVSNLTDIFLERKFMAEANQSLITVEFPEDREVSMIAYGFQNLDVVGKRVLSNTYGATTVLTNTYGAETVYSLSLAAGYILKDSSGNEVESGDLVVRDDTSIIYLDEAVTCRSVELLFTASDTLYIGGLSIGDPMDFRYIIATPDIEDLLLDSTDKTNGGQLIGQKIPMLRQWDIEIPETEMTNEKRLSIRTMLEKVGSYQPVFVDLWEDTRDEPPMYCNFSSIDAYGRIDYRRTYDFGFTLEECR
jgi:hypothetical protein